MAIDIKTATTGTVIGPFEFSFSEERASAFRAATGAGDSPEPGALLPPSAIIAEGLARLISELDLFGKEVLEAGGVVHTSQEAEFFAPVMPGENVIATAKLSGNTMRRGSRFLSVFTEFRNAANKMIATASSTIVVPV